MATTPTLITDTRFAPMNRARLAAARNDWARMARTFGPNIDPIELVEDARRADRERWAER